MTARGQHCLAPQTTEGPDEELRTLVGLARFRAETQAADLAYIFLKDGETEGARRTYGAIWKRGVEIAAALTGAGVEREPVVLLFSAGIEFIDALFGVMFAGSIPVPVYPPRGRGRAEHLSAIIQDSGARVVLTTQRIVERGTSLHSDLPSDMRWLTLESIESCATGRPPLEFEPDEEDLALLQYTSGSIGHPKGVRVTHRNILANEKAIQACFGLHERSLVAGWLPHYHDMGLIGTMLQPFFLGTCYVFMSPEAFLQRPSRWLQAISKYRATCSGAPNFAYELCLQRVEPQADWDLSSWSVAFVGAEPVRALTLERFASKFAQCGFAKDAFLPCYGLAESTLIVTGGHFRSSESWNGRACCGTSTGESRVAIVDPVSHSPLPDGEEGEIWINGPSVAQGYWRQEAESVGVLAASTTNGDGPFLRSGDLGVVRDGRLYVTGRMKNVLIHEGRNWHAEDIEASAAAAHASLGPGSVAAFAVDDEMRERQVLVCEVKRTLCDTLPVEEVAQAICRAVGEACEWTPSTIVFVGPGGVARTTSGKVREAMCRQMFVDGTLKEIGRWEAKVERVQPASLEESDEPEDLEQWLILCLARRLQVPADQIDLDATFAALGLDSSAAVAITDELGEHLGQELDPTLFWEFPTIAQVCEHLAEKREN